MSKVTYNLQLKGYVGGEDFDRKNVDFVLLKMDGKPVNVLIESLGGSLATGLSISNAFRNHGDVSVHFVGLNASAATIASLGAKHISMDKDAMYLVHKCSVEFFEWGSMNADSFSQLIAECEKTKENLDKLDMNCAELYATRCKRNPEELLELMKKGGWLTAQEAHDWGFVDEITDFADEPAPEITDDIVSAMICEGMPIPDLRVRAKERNSTFAKFVSLLENVISNLSNNSKKTKMSKTFKALNSLCSLGNPEFGDDAVTIKSEIMDSLENAVKNLQEKITDLSAQIEDRDKAIADLKASLDKTPAEDTKNVVESSKSSTETTEFSEYVSVTLKANSLFSSLP